MCNSQNLKEGKGSTAPGMEERPERFDHWRHRSMMHNEFQLPLIRSFIDQEVFKNLKLASIVDGEEVVKLRAIQKQVRLWVILQLEDELTDDMNPNNWSERLQMVYEFMNLLEAAVVSTSRELSFHALTHATYNGLGSDAPMYVLDFLTKGFFVFCNRLGEAESESYDGQNIHHHTVYFQIVSEFLNAILAFYQDHEAKQIRELKTA